MKLRSTEFFIASRLSSEPDRGKNRVMTRVATVAVAISVAVMIVSLSVIIGFKNEIASKVVGFSSHITITNLDNNKSYATTPISASQPFVDEIRSMEEVFSIAPYSIKSGVIENGGIMEGIALKGISCASDAQFIASNIKEGKMFETTDSLRKKEVILSTTLANRLNLSVGDKVKMLFIEEPPRRDAYTIAGIYDTSMPEFDKIMVYTDLRNVNRLYGWGNDSVSGFEIILKEIATLDNSVAKIEDLLFYGEKLSEDTLMTRSVTEENGAIFEWLKLQDINIVIISVIMLFTAGFNIIAMMLILLLERRAMIGVLKTLGMTNQSLQRLFLIRAGYITIRGVFYGVAMGLGLCLLQKYTGLVRLSEEAYFMSTVPIAIDIPSILLIIAGSIVAIVLIQLIPTLIISGISPDKSVNYK